MENRQTNYILAIHDYTDNIAMDTSIEEANEYLKKYPDRKVIIISKVYNNPAIKKIPYTQSMSVRKGHVRLIDHMGISDQEVLKTVLMGLKNGLLIIHHKIDIPDSFLSELINYHEKNIDVIIHRNQMYFTESEKEYFNSQMKIGKQHKALNQKYSMPRRMIIRLHNDLKFDVAPQEIAKYTQTFGNDVGYWLFLSQFILLKKRNEYRRQLQAVCEKNNQIFDDFIDPFIFEQESANFLYFDIAALSIIDGDKEIIEKSHNEILQMLSNIKH